LLPDLVFGEGVRAAASGADAAVGGVEGEENFGARGKVREVAGLEEVSGGKVRHVEADGGERIETEVRVE